MKYYAAVKKDNSDLFIVSWENVQSVLRKKKAGHHPESTISFFFLNKSVCMSGKHVEVCTPNCYSFMVVEYVMNDELYFHLVT